MKRFIEFVSERPAQATAVAFALFLLLTVLTGCQPAPENRVGFEEDEAELMVNCLLDVTGSFEKEMLGADGRDGRAFKTFLAVRDRFFRDRRLSKDRFLVTRISGSKKALLLDAVPQSFEERFPDAESFRRFILSQPDPGGSRVYDSLRDALDYMVLQHQSSRKLKSAVLAWTDMDDNRPDGPDSKQKLVESLRGYARVGGVIGIYGCELASVPEWSRVLADAGFKSYVIEPDIRENPRLPVFD
jgi:hypothetical protein